MERRGLFGVSPSRLRTLLRLGSHLLAHPAPKPKLFERWVGKFVFAAQFRRPVFSFMDVLFPRLREPSNQRLFSSSVGEEVLRLVVLVPFLCTDLRAPLSSRVLASDASSLGGAVVEARLSSSLGRELYAKLDYRGAIPDGVAFSEDPVARSAFDPAGEGVSDWSLLKQWQWRLEGHINAKEMGAVLFQLKVDALCTERHSERFFHGLDSSVSIGVFAKGRSTSWKLNRLASRSACCLLGAFRSMLPFFFSTHVMPADEPSREFPSSLTTRSLPAPLEIWL